jgi:ribonuclease P protein component
MLSAGQRLRRREEFTAAMRAGRRGARGCLVVHLRRPEAPGAPEARAGFVIPRAVGSAVDRNRVRRRLRHHLRGRLTGLPAGTDVVIRVLPGAAAASYQELTTDLDAALAAAGRGRSRPAAVSAGERRR